MTHEPTGRNLRAGKALRIKATVALGVIMLSLLGLVGQLARIQIVEAEDYQRRADRQHMVSRELAARRGRIYDRAGRLLAVSVQRWSIYADPKGVQSPTLVAAALSRALGTSRSKLERDLQKDCYFVWVKRQVSDEDAQRVRRLGLDGVHMRREPKRLYPQGRLAAHVLGFTDIDGRGLAGVERSMDELLRGRPGMETVLCDGGRRIFRSPADRVERSAFNGFDIHLTLDAYVQSIAEQELDAAVEKHEPESGAVVVLDARDCSVLAMASWPSFDPQRPASSPVAHQRNTALSDAYEYGSVLKAIAVGAALEQGKVTPATEFDCHGGEWRIGSRTVHDAHEFGVLPVRDIIAHSSNIGMAQIGMELGAELLYSAVRQFGLGAPTGIALPGEIGGIVRPLSSWNNYSVVSVSFGHELAVTALAVARAFCVFAADGALLQPRIVQRIVPHSGGEAVYTAGGPMVQGYPLSRDAARQMLAMLERVVSLPDATGRRVRLQEYSVAGKTGTGQMLTADGRGYSDERYVSSFVGIAPAEKPRIVVLVTLRAPSKNGYYGGLAAGPAVREIIRRTLRYMRVPPSPPPPLTRQGETRT